MKNQIIIFLLLLFLSVNIYAQETIKPIPEKEMYDHFEASLLKGKEKFVERKGNDLIFKLGNGKKKIFESDPDSIGESHCVFYMYRGYLKSINSYVVNVHYYEGGEFILINSYSGDTTILDGIPYVSPNAKFIYINNPCLICASFSPNIAQIWEMKKGKPIYISNLVKDSCQFENPKWINNNEILIDKHFIYNDSNNKWNDFVKKGRIVFEGGKWFVKV